MAYIHHPPMSSSSVQPGQDFEIQAYAQQTQHYQQYRASTGSSPHPSPNPSPRPSPQPYVYQQVNRPPPSPQYNQAFTFPPRSPQPPIQQSYRPPPSPQPIFPLPQGYIPPAHIPPSLQARVKTPAPPEQTTASPRPQYAYLPQQNVITSVSTPSPPRATSPSRPLPPPQRSRPESMPPTTRIQLPVSSFTENTLYRQPSTVSVSPTRTPSIAHPPGPGPSVSPQPPLQAPVHRPSYSAGSVSPPKPVSSFGPPVPNQMPAYMLGQIPGQMPIQVPYQRSQSPNKGRPLPNPTPRTPSPTKTIQSSIASPSVKDNTPQRQQPQQPLPSMTRSATEVNSPSSNAQETFLSGPIHGTISTSSHNSPTKEITLPPAMTSGQPFVPYWKRNLQGGPRAYGVERRGTISEGPSSTPAIETPQPSTSSVSSSNSRPSIQSEIQPRTVVTRKPTNSFDFGGKGSPGPQPQTQPEPRRQPRPNGTNGSKDLHFSPGTTTQQPPARSLTSQTPSTFSMHQRRGAETTRTNTGPDPPPPSNPNHQPQSRDQPNHNRFSSTTSTVSASTTASTSGSAFSSRSIVPPSKPIRSQTYDPRTFAHREAPEYSIANQHQEPPSPKKLSSREKVGQAPARTPSPQYGILDIPRSRFSQRVEAKTEALNGLRGRDSSPVRSESPTKSTPSVSPFARSESSSRNHSPVRSQGLPRPTSGSPDLPPTNASPFPPALKRNSVTPQSVTLQMATISIGEDRNRSRPLDQHQVQRSSSPPKPQQGRTQQNGITKSDSGWPSNLPRLPRTPATSQHPNSTANFVNGARSVPSTFPSSDRTDSVSHPSTSTSSFDRSPVRASTDLPNHSNPRFSPRQDERRPILELDLDDAPPPSLRRSPSPASSVASSNFSSFSAAMESYRNGVSGSQFSVSARNTNPRTGSAPVRQSTEPMNAGSGHLDSQSQSQPRIAARQQTFPRQPQVQTKPQPQDQHWNSFPPRSHSPDRQRQQQPPQSPRRQPASPAVPSINAGTAPLHYQPSSPTVPKIKTTQAQPSQRQKISFPANPDSDSDGDANGPRIAVSVVDDGDPGPKFSASGSDNVPSISINVGGTDDDYGNDPAINLNPGRPSVAVNDGRKSVAELPTIRRGGGLSCGGCGGMIVGRVVNAMGARWHPGCFRCCMCNELLENLSSYEKDGRSFCHLDYHELYAPRCYHCHTAIVDERFITLDDSELGTRTYHEQHFFCAECGDPFLAPSSPASGGRSFAGDGAFEDADVGFTVYKGHPYCENCHVRLRMPKCKRCKRSIRDGMRAVEALGGKWCWECFVCTGCEKPFDDPTFFQRDQQPFCERCFSIMIRNEV
ncbi:hypothetical protein BJ322DRAFT_1046199 [Thelephora terrestris]|uniref:LIM zinc-binding domain-containing protein n=1 Tax=Thelephora terrestris TaxID=56493 RepID=A0A9P6L923_9AGAM|nr:hypothetical protein BJ322DRAFT_1046199 [Thelephora terrestris]